MPTDNPAPPPAAWTVQALLNWTTNFLHTKGVEAPRLEAQVLLAHVLGCTKIDLMVRFHEEPAADDRGRFRELVRKRVEHWPVAYLVGKREFYMLAFEVSPAVLVPRPETELLVLQALAAIKGKSAPRVLDLGTGSGCVAVSLAHNAKTATVDAVDVSPDALELAARNAETHGVADRITFHRGDLFTAVPDGATFDAIASNPPYVTPAELAESAPEVRDHEPRLALDGGPDGLAFYRRIAADAARFLKPGGTLLVEIGSTQEAAVRALVAAAPGLAAGPTFKDGAGHPRVVTAKRV